VFEILKVFFYPADIISDFGKPPLEADKIDNNCGQDRKQDRDIF